MAERKYKYLNLLFIYVYMYTYTHTIYTQVSSCVMRCTDTWNRGRTNACAALASHLCSEKNGWGSGCREQQTSSRSRRLKRRDAEALQCWVRKAAAQKNVSYSSVMLHCRSCRNEEMSISTGVVARSARYLCRKKSFMSAEDSFLYRKCRHAGMNMEAITSWISSSTPAPSEISCDSWKSPCRSAAFKRRLQKSNTWALLLQ